MGNLIDVSKVKKGDDLTSAQEEVLKSFTTGHGITPETQVDGGALRREFLETNIAMQTWTKDDLTFYRDITKVPVTSTVVKYDVYLSHGRVGASLFTTEIGVSEVNDPSLEQRIANMKFLSDTKQLTIASSIVSNIAEPLEILTNSAMETIARTIEWASFYGDGDLSDQNHSDTGLEFNGLAKLIDKDNVIDARGKKLTEEILNQGAVLITKGFGRPTDAYMPVGVHADFVNTLLGRQVQLMSSNGQGVTTGYNVQGFNSARGHIRLHGSTVMELENILDEYAPVRPNAPQTPKVEAVVADNALGKFREEELAESALAYRVTSHSDGATSNPSEITEASVTKTAQGVTLTITLPAMYQQRPKFISVYRRGLNTRQFYLLKRIPVSEAKDGVITFVDTNDDIAETADVFMGEMSQNVVNLFELLPMMRLPLARTNASETFAVLWYGALALRSPKRWVRIKNVDYIATDNIRSEGIYH